MSLFVCTYFVLALLQDKERCSNQYVCKFCKENYNLKQTKTNYPNPHSVLNGYDKYKTNEYGKLEKNFKSMCFKCHIIKSIKTLLN